MSLLTHEGCPHYLKGGCSAMGGDSCRGEHCNWLAEIGLFQNKTLKAVAEWLDERCESEEPSHAPYGGLRITCRGCMDELWLALHDGKMPGEE